ncbi:hypothetical protein GGI05_004538 [Coemansia sp. RSA 2603]|nr:hypothetical protein GGI05_004538 [Coemansia sp. RSA 2603]
MRRLVVVVQNSQLDALGHTDAARFVFQRGQRVGAHLVGGLRHRIRLEHRGAQPVLQGLQHRGGEGRGARAHKADVGPVFGDLVTQDYLVYGGHRGVPRGVGIRVL